jgi:hypothetical protein
MARDRESKSFDGSLPQAHGFDQSAPDLTARWQAVCALIIYLREPLYLRFYSAPVPKLSRQISGRHSTFLGIEIRPLGMNG